MPLIAVQSDVIVMGGHTSTECPADVRLVLNRWADHIGAEAEPRTVLTSEWHKPRGMAFVMAVEVDGDSWQRLRAG